MTPEPTDDDPEQLASRAEDEPWAVDLEAVFAALDDDGAADRRGGATALAAVARDAPDRLAAHADALARCIRSGERDRRRAAIAAVRDAGRADPDGFAQLVDPLRECLGDQPPDEAKLTGSALAALLEPGSPELSKTIHALVANLGDDESHVYALTALGSTFPGETVAALEPLVSGSDRNAVRSALEVLASISEVDPGATAEVAPAVGAHLTDGDERTTRFAAEVLGNVVTEAPAVVAGDVERLADLFDADDAATRREAAGFASSLARADPDAVAPIVPALVERLSDADRIVRRDACYALGVVRAERARDAIEALEGEASPELSAVATRALDRIDGGTGEPPLPEIQPSEVFQHRGGGPDRTLTPEEREQIRKRRLRRREDRSRN